MISAVRKNGELAELRIQSEKGGKLRLVNPFKNKGVVAKSNRNFDADNRFIEMETREGEIIVLTPKQ